MTEMEWTRPAAAGAERAGSQWVRRTFGRFGDWEDWLTLLMLAGATLSVSAALESVGWSQNMPRITLMSGLAVIASWLLARSALSVFMVWPLAVLIGALATFWQTLERVGPGNLEQRIDAIYSRFDTWSHLAFSGGVSKDSLPFDTLVLGLTWLGVFLFGWSVYRWHNAWIGLIPGGIALFVDLAFVGDDLTGSVLLYFLFGFLLVMRTNLMAHMTHWRSETASYPPLISLTFLNFGAWVLLILMAAAWIAPVGPFSTPKPIRALIDGAESIGVNFVRLAGPLQVKKVVPVHNYTGVLPFRGSVKLGQREVLSVKVNDETIKGPIRLRGAIYDEYSTGGWTAGARTTVDLPPVAAQRVRLGVEKGEIAGEIVPLTIKVERKSVVGTVLFSPGEPVSASVPFEIDVPEGSVSRSPLALPGDGVGLSDEEILSEYVPKELGNGRIGLRVERDDKGRVTNVVVFQGRGQALPDALVINPPESLPEGRSYNISGFIPTVAPDDLRRDNGVYPNWIEQEYLQLPDTLPAREGELAKGLAAGKSSAYDDAKAIESYLRGYTVDYKVTDTPPEEDTVDYFLFESRRGYFDYHASAMVVLLRAIGVPSRLAVGFVVDEADFDRQSGSYVVTDHNTYAWVEVYFPEHGWIAFNPSPDRPADLTPTKGNPQTAEGERTLEDFPGLPVSADPVINFPIEGAGSAGGAPARSQENYNPLITLAATAFLAMLAGAAYLGWQRSVAGLPYSHQLWEKAVRLATWAGHSPQPGQTVTDFARSLERFASDASGVRLLASAYNRSRFGKREVTAEERERLRETWPQLRGDLLAAIRSRVLRRGR